MKSIINLGLALIVALSAFAGAAFADDYPNKPITIIVGYSAGGGTDIMARTVAPYLERALGPDAHVVIKNKPGAGGQIGFASVAHAKPDGYTLGTFNLPAALALTYSRNADYGVDSFDYLANVVSDPNTLVVPASSDIKSVDALVEAAKNSGAPMTVALSALGGNDHFAALEFSKAAGIDFNYVPFSGASQARNALMGGHVQVGTMALSQTVQFDEKLRVLTVFSDQPSAFAPDVPTAKSLGYDIEMGSLRGIVAPAGLPEAIKTRLISALKTAFDDPELQKTLKKQGNATRFVSGDAYRVLAQQYYQSAGQLWKESPWK